MCPRDSSFSRKKPDPAAGEVTECTGFPPLADARATRLILGSMPGAASLRAGEYYAHPANVFWRLFGELLGAGPDLPYDRRSFQVREAGIAIWDVLATCRRSGSLDSDIEPASVRANDFVNFFAAHPAIRRIGFNGAVAETLFRRHVLPRLDSAAFEFVRLPSTSPANAAIDYNRKRLAWRQFLAGAALNSETPCA